MHDLPSACTASIVDARAHLGGWIGPYSSKLVDVSALIRDHERFRVVASNRMPLITLGLVHERPLRMRHAIWLSPLSNRIDAGRQTADKDRLAYDNKGRENTIQINFFFFWKRRYSSREIIRKFDND
jgi:hypothetical protein